MYGLFYSDVFVTSTVSNGNQFAFVQNHTMTTLAQLVTENNPTSLLQYGIVLIHEMNEVSRQESLISPTYSHIDDRNTVRNRITLAVLGLPLETKYQQNQKAFILCYLTVNFILAFVLRDLTLDFILIKFCLFL